MAKVFSSLLRGFRIYGAQRQGHPLLLTTGNHSRYFGSQTCFRGGHKTTGQLFRLAIVGVSAFSIYNTISRDEKFKTNISQSSYDFPLRWWQSLLGEVHQLSPWLDTTNKGYLPVNFSRTDGTDTLNSNSPPFIGIKKKGSTSPPYIGVKEKGSDDVGDENNSSSGCLGRNSIANAAALVGPAVVNLSVTQGFSGMTLGKNIGSGTIIDPDGTILTCAHVVVGFQSARSPYKRKVDVTLQDGRTFEGEVVNADFHSDIAVVKIKSKTPLPAAKLGSSGMLRPGDWVVALGCPLSLQNTITAGIVSCVDRKSSDLGLAGIRREYLQTDCAINEGNSGGPLVNLDGEVIGVNIMKIVDADGLSFAVPIDSIIKIIEQFKKNGRVVRPWLGLRMLDLNNMIVAQLKERDTSFPDVNRGVLVPLVTPGSPADRAGFLPGDVVVELDGKPVGSVEEVVEVLEDKVGVPMKAVVKRSNNNTVTLTVVPEEANPVI
ncbi:putative protease Do-like 14 [Amborella trichopoda]|uniref:putative protease Do-like 14 n=1 Tax=Amborella trichopoda TaxID=13333 RepID=UPI0005D40BA8|nr:putative protease Do-like 14 [Amborella trichopoda]|eukprot:XP_011628683.1 putative protease Do-like 14 [Amborella trichopoda]